MSRLWLLVIGLSFFVGVVQAQGLERLFTSAAQRSQIDQERWQSKQQTQKSSNSAGSAEGPRQRQLFFEALLKTERGFSVWLNGRMFDQPQNLQGIRFDPNQVRAAQLYLQTPKGIRRLALGQVYWIDQDKVLEPYEKP